MLNLMVLRSLTDSYKAVEGEEAKNMYINYLKLTKVISKQFVDYANFAFDKIMHFYDKSIRESCVKSFTCGNTLKIDETKWFEKVRVMAMSRDCYCKMRPDVSGPQWCAHYNRIRTDYIWDDQIYKIHRFTAGSVNEYTAMEQWSKRVLFDLSHKYWKTTSEVVRAYWQENVMTMVPEWQTIGDNAQAELNSNSKFTNKGFARKVDGFELLHGKKSNLLVRGFFLVPLSAN